METDEALYRCFLGGDEEGLRALMERYGNALTLYICGYIHDVHESEDLMIEAFAYLVAKRPNIWENSFKPYLYKSARHLALRQASRQRLHPHFSLDELSGEPESAELIESVVQTGERDRLLRLCMARLPDDYREALYLIYFEGVRYAEAAEIMGKTEKQITDLAYRGRQSLRRLLEQEGITDANDR